MLTAATDLRLISLSGARSKMPDGRSGRFSKSITCFAFAPLQRTPILRLAPVASVPAMLLQSSAKEHTEILHHSR